jgi:short subunit dehydrogenase-like uncharacterized protein
VAVYGVLGGTGATGRLLLRSLAEAGHAVALGARDPAALDRVIPEDLDVASRHRVDTERPDEVRGFLGHADVLLTTVGPFGRLGQSVARAALEAGVPYVDSAGEQGFLRWMEQDLDGPARAAGTTLVPAAGFESLLGDLLAARAAAHLVRPREVHVAYALPRTTDLLLGTTRGTRASIAGMLGGPMLALVDGEPIEERPGEQRRLAWFPRPAGPRHAAAVPGGEALSVPRHVPGVETVRTYLALPSLGAELLQAASGWARRPGVRDRLSRWLLAPGDPSPARREATRWACVAEAADGERVSRAWAYGADIYSLTAHAMVVIAERLVGGGVPPGVVAPAQVDAADRLLDDLATRTGLHWSVAPPA